MEPQDQTHQNSATSHTPGPWRIERPIPSLIGEIWIRGKGRGYWRCQSVAEIFVCNGIQREEAEANARLIAAAPELLAACKRLVNNFLDASRDFQARDMALTAICKAQAAQGSEERAGKANVETSTP